MRKFLIIGALIAYFAAYLHYSKDGFYAPASLGPKSGQSGAIFSSKGVGLVWQPFGGSWLGGGSNDRGWKPVVFMPLVYLDRAVWHRNKNELRLP